MSLDHVKTVVPPLDFPWTKPTGEYSHYVTDGPEARTKLEFYGVLFVITPTDKTGCDTGRRRFLVECRTCAEQLHLWSAVVHPAATGPRHYVAYHLDEAHNIKVQR